MGLDVFVGCWSVSIALPIRLIAVHGLMRSSENGYDYSPCPISGTGNQASTHPSSCHRDRVLTVVERNEWSIDGVTHHAFLAPKFF